MQNILTALVSDVADQHRRDCTSRQAWCGAALRKYFDLIRSRCVGSNVFGATIIVSSVRVSSNACEREARRPCACDHSRREAGERIYTNSISVVIDKHAASRIPRIEVKRPNFGFKKFNQGKSALCRLELFATGIYIQVVFKMWFHLLHQSP